MRYFVLLAFMLLPFIGEAQSKKQKKQYASYIVSADSAFAVKNYIVAKEKYKLASAIKPKEQHPLSRITECDKLYIIQTAEYKKILHRADSCFEKQNWAAAKTLYLQANAVKPSESYASDQAKNCNYQIVAKNAMEERYNESIRTGDSCFTAKSWACAKANYEAASRTKPEQQYPKERIALCTQKMVVAVDKERYDIAIADADMQFDAGNYFAAKRLYTEALTFNPAATYPVQRIAVCDAKLSEPK